MDALDECKEDQREQIISFISDLTNDLPRAKVFVTSRRETDIVEAFARWKTPTIQIEPRNIAEDIDVFVRDRVEALVGLGTLRLENPALKGRIIETLITRAEGM
jgi:ankyrin repeat domain-containing protein 50